MKKSFEKAAEIFKEHSGILRLSQAMRLGIPEHIIYEMHAEGLLAREQRGLYRLVGAEPLGNPDLVRVARLVPKGVICLTSALYVHNLTTEIPDKVYIALPANILNPKIEYPPLEVVYLTEIPYQAGIETHTLDGVEVKVYSREKTVADCFKFRDRIAQAVALDALKDYLSAPGRDVEKLRHFARIDRVEKRMRPYIEALL